MTVTHVIDRSASTTFLRVCRVIILAGAIVTGVSIQAHHSFATYYFEDQSVSIEGTLDTFEYRAPHAWVYVIAPDTEGQPRRFAAEWANPTRLRGDGITRDTLKAGDHVVITGSPGRVPTEYKIHLKGIRRPADGWEWRGGRRGGGRRR
jgi:hypothetical protein